MGLLPLPLSLLLAAAPVVTPLGSAPAPASLPMARETFDALLLEGDLSELQEACVESAGFGANDRLQQLRDRLLQVAPAPQPFSVVMANARALMTCKDPAGAQRVLSRYGPGTARQRREWLLLSWHAASAALDQERAILALLRLADGQPGRLEGEQLVVGLDAQGQPLVRSGLDVLAQAQVASGQTLDAVQTLLAGRTPGKVAARRLAIVAELLAELEPDRSAPLLETALDQAAADQAWSLAEELLRLQLRLELANGGSGERPRERLRRLATRVDDQFTLLELEEEDPLLTPEQRQQLEQQLRSPREPGGHAALGESPNPEAGASGVDDQP